jgi:hypothetical protein
MGICKTQFYQRSIIYPVMASTSASVIFGTKKTAEGERGDAKKNK